MMDYKDKEEIQLDSLKRLLEGIEPYLNKAHDDEQEAKGWQKGFLEFIKVLEQVSFKAGYKQGIREGLEFYQKSLETEINVQKSRYKKLRDSQKDNTSPDTHPDDRVIDINQRREDKDKDKE
jgi:hypothetical protein